MNYYEFIQHNKTFKEYMISIKVIFALRMFLCLFGAFSGFLGLFPLVFASYVPKILIDFRYLDPPIYKSILLLIFLGLLVIFMMILTAVLSNLIGFKGFIIIYSGWLLGMIEVVALMSFAQEINDFMSNLMSKST